MRSLVDCHCHLQQLPLNTIIEGISSGVTHLICNSTSENDWYTVLNLKSENITPCIGVHPWYLNEASADWEEKMRELIKIKGVHVGEIGLDNNKSKIVSKPLQESFFTKQIRMAKDYNKVANVHCVSAFGKLLKILTNESPNGDLKVLLHSWEGPWDITNLLLNHFKTNVIFSLSMVSVSKDKHRDVVLNIPHTNIVIETDSPSQFVESLVSEEILEYHNGRPINKPIYLKYVLKRLANIRNTTPETLSQQIFENFERIYNAE